MKKYYLLSTLIFLCFTFTIFAQTTYNGPAVGSVTSGVIVSTDNFTASSKDDEITVEPHIFKLLESDEEPLYIENNGPINDNYVYVEGGTKRFDHNIGTSFELHSYESIPMQNGWPPDPTMSVGPNHIVSAVNGRFHIYDRDGILLKNISETQWIAQVINTPVITDPQVIYDHHHGRWVMLWLTINNAILQAPFVIAYSDDENPLGTWYMYAIGSELNGSTNAGNYGDYPKIGYDDQALYINSRQFGFAGGLFYDKIRILNSADFYAAQGGPVSWTDIWNIRVNNQVYDVIHPYYSYDTAQNAAYFVYARSSGANFYQLFKLADPIINPILTSTPLITATPYGRAPSAQQPAGDPVDNFTWVSKAPVLRDGLLYTAHAISNSQNPIYSSIKYFVIDVNSNTLVEEVEQGEDGYFFITPAITVDKDHNIAITYSKSSSSTYIGAYYSTRLSTDPPGLSESKVMTLGQAGQTNANRWGDYFGAAVDPVNQYDIWLFCEYAKTSNWSTWLTEIRMKPYDGAHAYAKSFTVDFGNLEVGASPETITVPFSNYGTDDLVISSVSSPSGPFTLLTSVPFTLAPYDSIDLEFEFNPTEALVYDELMSFTNNDPNFLGFTMKGRGFEINETYTDVFYAISNATLPDTGKTLWLDKSSGGGGELGESNFADVRALTVDPVSNIMYGTVPGASSSDLVRVNAAAGDAYTLYTLDGLGFMVGVAFDTSGVLYGALQNGSIYSIDLSNGTTILATTSPAQLTAIAFDPITNELWATPRLLVGQKDKIFKIDLLTGDTTNVGRTGFNIQSNDLTFDETGALYAVIGGATEVGKLISINKTSGVGTLVGEIGYTNVQSLAYSINSTLSSVKGGEIIPSEFSLKQNYPNPFNPTTKIEYRIADLGFVTLKVYDVLGNEVMTLLNEQKPAGNYEVEFNASSFTSGVYFYQLKSGSSVQTKKMILLK